MKDLCLFYDSNNPNVVLLSLFDNADIDFKNIKNSFPDASYEICAIYLTKMQSLDAVSRLFGAAFRIVQEYSMTCGVLCIAAPVDQVINWLRDMAKLTGTEKSLFVYPIKEVITKKAHPELDNQQISTQHISFENEVNQSVPDNTSTEYLQKKSSGKNLSANHDDCTSSCDIKNRGTSSSGKKHDNVFDFKEVIKTSLDKAPNLSRKKLAYIVYKEHQYPIESWNGLLEKILKAIDNGHSKQMRDLASSRNVNPTFNSLPSLVLRAEGNSYKQLPKSGVYFLTNLVANDTIKFINYVLGRFGADPRDLVIAYYDGKNNTKSNEEQGSSSSHDTKVVVGTQESDIHPTTKAAIVNYLIQSGYTPRGVNIKIARVLNGVYTFSLRRTFLRDDWTLILDDTTKEKYYIFEIPKESIDTKNLKWWKNHNKYQTTISISYGDMTFTNKMSKAISFDRYPKFEMNYSRKPSPTMYKESVIDVESIKNKTITRTPLSQVPYDLSDHLIAYLVFQGDRYNTVDWTDALDKVVNCLYKKDSDAIYLLAYNNIGLDLKTKEPKHPFFSLGKEMFSDEDLAHCINGTNIYFKTNYSVAIIVNRCIKGLLNLFHEDLTQLVFAYY